MVVAQILARPADLLRPRLKPRLVQQGLEMAGGLQSRADGGQVARPPAAHRQARQGPHHVRPAPEAFADRRAQVALVDQVSHGLGAAGDGVRVGQRRGQALGQQPAAGAGHRAVDRAQEAALAAAGERLDQLEVAPGGGVDLQDSARGQPRGGRQARQAALLGQFDIFDDRAGGGHLGAGEEAEGVQGLDAVERLETAAGVVAVEARRGQRAQDRLPFGEDLEQGLVLQQGLGQQQFARAKPTQGGRQIGRRQGLGLELAGGDVEPRQAKRAAGLGEGRQMVVAAGVEQLVLGQGAGSHEAHHRPFDHRFGAPLLGLRWILDLLADGHLEALADEAGEIAVGAVHRHAAHGNVLAQVLAAFGQRDIEGLGGQAGIVEEELVEIAHAIEQEAVRVGPLDFQVLGHHGGGPARPLSGGLPGRRFAATVRRGDRLVGGLA